MKKYLLLACLLIAGCSKYGMSGCVNHEMGNWTQATPPTGCKVKQIAAEESGGVVILCEDGRIFR